MGDNLLGEGISVRKTLDWLRGQNVILRLLDWSLLRFFRRGAAMSMHGTEGEDAEGLHASIFP
jgi:hypothetical protein